MSDDLQLQDCVKTQIESKFFVVVLAMKLCRDSGGTAPFIHNLCFKPDRFLPRGRGGPGARSVGGWVGPFFLKKKKLYCSEMYKCLHEFPYKTVPDTSLRKMSGLIEEIENVLR